MLRLTSSTGERTNQFVGDLGCGRRKRVFGGALFALGVAIAPLGAAHAAAPAGTHWGDAYGTRGWVSVGPVGAGLGATAYLPVPCLGVKGGTVSSSLASVTSGNAFSTGGILTTVQTTTTANSVTDEVVSKVAGLKAFKGLVTADAIVAVVRTTANATSVKSEDLGTSFVNLTIAGQKIAANVSPNTSIALPGIGTATLRKQTRSGNGVYGAYLGVDMISVNVTVANTYGLPIGAVLNIGHAASGFVKSLPVTLTTGGAYLSYANATVDSVLAGGSGAAGFQPLSCFGTDGKTLTTSVLGLNLGALISVGTGETSVMGGNGVAKTTASVANVNLLGGLIRATGVKAVAQTSIVGGVKTRSTTGSGLTGLKVLGLPIAVNVKPNTRIDLPGIGYVIINEQFIPGPKSDADTQVNALHVYVNKANVLGLPVGANILIGRATAGVVNSKTGV